MLPAIELPVGLTGVGLKTLFRLGLAVGQALEDQL